LVLSPAPQDLKKIVDNVASLVKPRGSLTINVPENTMALIDIDYFERVLWNLIKNADEATRGINNGKIEIETHHNGGSITVTVRDNGPGFPRGIITKDLHAWGHPRQKRRFGDRAFQLQENHRSAWRRHPCRFGPWKMDKHDYKDSSGAGNAVEERLIF
jgi:light-regulated signal transduction histidine kinase (bacteriophytochrome)